MASTKDRYYYDVDVPQSNYNQNSYMEELPSESFEAPEPSAESSQLDWNERFQEILDLEESKEKYLALSDLAMDFVYAAQNYGKIIISETFLPNERKTIQPIIVPGQAGGEKYKVQDILFKLITPSPKLERIYGGIENAIKSSGHELKGLINFFNCTAGQIRIPLMCLVDYRGFRIIALSVLPISVSTIRVGTCDGGENIHEGSPAIQELLTNICSKLNIKVHTVKEMSSGTLKRVFGPADLEVHLGQDGRLYSCDFARIFPPTEPILKGDVMTRYFRAEFLRKYPIPLSSDGFIAFGSSDPDKLENEQQIRIATAHLFNETIPEFVRHVSNNYQLSSVTNITQQMHRHGINLRYLGRVYSLLQIETLKQLFLNEMLARLIKKLLAATLREEMMKYQFPGQQPYRKATLNFYNQILSKNPALFEKMASLLQNKFGAPGISLLKPNETLENLINFFELFSRLDQITGVHLAEKTLQDLKTRGTQKFVDPDLISMEPTTKHLNITSYYSGLALLVESKETSSKNQVIRFLRLAVEQFKSSVAAEPSNFIKLEKYNKSLISLAGFTTDYEESINCLTTAESNCYSILEEMPNNLQVRHKLAKALVHHAVKQDSRLQLEPYLLLRALTCYDLLLKASYKPSRVLNGLKEILKLVISLDVEEDLVEKKLNQKYQLFVDLMMILRKTIEMKAALMLPALEESSYLSQCFGLKYVSEDPTVLQLVEPHISSLKKLILPYNLSIVSSFAGSLAHVLVNVRILDLSLCSVSDEYIATLLTHMNFLDTLTLWGCTNLTDNVVPTLKAHSSLKHLDLTRVPLTDLGIQQLIEGLTLLETLNLARALKASATGTYKHPETALQKSTITNLAFQGFASLSFLTSLNLSAIPISNLAASAIGHLTNLQTLCLFGCSELDEEAFLDLFKDLKQLKHLDISLTNVTDKALSFISSVCTDLEYLDLIWCENLKSSGIETLVNCKKMKHLWLDWNPFLTDQCVISLLETFGENLLSLSLLNCTLCTDAIFTALQNCRSLRYLNLTGCKLTDQGIVALQACKNLEILNLAYLRSPQARGETWLPIFASCRDLKLVIMHGSINVSQSMKDQMQRISSAQFYFDAPLSATTLPTHELCKLIYKKQKESKNLIDQPFLVFRLEER